MLKKLEGWYCVFGVLFFAGGLIPNQRAQSEKSEALNHMNTLLQAVVFGILFFLLILNFRTIAAGLLRVKNIAMICGLAVLSTLWSVESSFTIRRAIIFCGFTLFTIYFSNCYSFEDQVDLFYKAVAFEIIATILVAIFMPNAGISSDLHAGAWKGLFIHKNNLGQFMGLSCLFLLVTKPPGKLQVFRGFLLASAFVLLYLSQSSTPVFSVVFVLSILGFISLSRVQKRNHLPLWIALTPLIVAATTALVLIRGVVLQSAGKDSTLSGRLPIWQAALAMIAKRPWFGYGYAAFWETRNIYSLGVRNVIRWPGAPHAHNGYIDTLIDLGIVGLGLFLFGYAISLSKAFYRARHKLDSYPALPIAILLFMAFQGLTESTLIQSHQFPWLPYVWVTCELARFSRKASVEVPQEGDARHEDLARYA